MDPGWYLIGSEIIGIHTKDVIKLEAIAIKTNEGKFLKITPEGDRLLISEED